MSGRQWLREYRLVVGGDNGAGLDLSNLRIVFDVTRGDYATPNTAEISVYNLSDATTARIKGEFTQVWLAAGYQGASGLIFKGTIKQARTARENQTDRALILSCADGDRAYNFATVNCTLAAGATPKDQIAASAEAMKQKGVDMGYMPDNPGGKALPRGKVMYGMSRDYLRDAARTTDASWSIQDGKIQMVPAASYLPGEAVVLTGETGLISSPEQTNEGIKLQCLLNPRLKAGGRVRLNNNSIREAKKDMSLGAINKAPKLDRDGFYRILKINYSGDTHGQDWFCDLVCIGIDQTSLTTLDRI